LNGRRAAFSTERLPERWQQLVETQGHATGEQAEIAQHEAASEHLLMNLRLTEGLNLPAYEARWGLSLNRKNIHLLEEQGLVGTSGDRLVVTPQGRLVLNSVIAELAP
jgi:oxygen-independent coproporphyrinogen-3 oxidase